MERTLRTKRLVLRPFESADLEAVRRYFSDPAWSRYLSPDFPDAERFVSHQTTLDWERDLGFAIVREGRVIGSVHIGREPVDLRGQLACLIAPDHWRSGIALEACTALLELAFGALGLWKVHARADARNVASIRAMERLGMEREGLLRSHRVNRDGGRSDEVQYGLLREDWIRLFAGGRGRP
jgi:RimJ/RimL family protein N-acetyltransferase